VAKVVTAVGLADRQTDLRAKQMEMLVIAE
jgi:hypothetical protein